MPMSKEGRRKISRAQKARWRKIRAEKEMMQAAAEREPQELRAPRRKRARKTTTVAIEGTKYLQDALERVKEQLQERIKEEIKEQLQSDFIWTTGSGEKIRPHDMTEDHLRNTISMIVRKLVHQIGTATWVTDIHPRVKALDAMLEEAKRRNLRI